MNHSVVHLSKPRKAVERSLLKNLIRRTCKRYRRKVGHQMLLYLFYFAFFVNSVGRTCVIRNCTTQTARLLTNTRDTYELFTEDDLGHYILSLKIIVLPSRMMILMMIITSKNSNNNKKSQHLPNEYDAPSTKCFAYVISFDSCNPLRSELLV